MRSPILAALAACVLLIAADAPDDANKKDLDKLQGTWKVVVAQTRGKDFPVDQLIVQGMTFDGDRFTTMMGGRADHDGKFKLDASKTPATIDLIDKDGKLFKQGIYQFDGDTLKMAFVSNDEGRPTELVSKPGSGVVVLTLKPDKK